MFSRPVLAEKHPNYRVYTFGENKETFTDHETLEVAMQALLDSLPKDMVKEITAARFHLLL